MQMCELSLEETGLTRKRGAEILEHEFNREWEKLGGATYVKPATRAKWSPTSRRPPPSGHGTNFSNFPANFYIYEKKN